MTRNALAPHVGVLLVATLAAVLPGGAAADFASSLDFYARLDGNSRSAMSLTRLAPTLELQLPRLRVFADAAASATGDRLGLRAARTSVGGRLFRLGKIDAELVATSAHLDPADAPGRQALRAHGRLVMAGRRSGIWVGGGNQLASERDGVGPALIALGAWTRAGAISLSGGLDQTQEVHTSTTFPAGRVAPTQLDTIGIVGPQRSLRENLMATHAHARFGWGRGPFDVETIAGISFGRRLEPKRWAQARMTLAVVNQVALVATAGSTAPQWFAFDASGQRRATLGLRLTPSLGQPSDHVTPPSLRPVASQWRLQRIEPGRYAIRVRASGASSVEIMGDMTGWEAVALERLGGSQWGIELEMTPGVHRMNLRIDQGTWNAPPGVAAAPDDFNGEVGLIVVE